MHGGKLLDGVVPPHADGRVVNLSSTTAPRPDEIEGEHLWAILQVVASVFLSVGRQALIGGKPMKLDHELAERVLAAVWRKVFGPAIHSEAQGRLLAQPGWLRKQLVVVEVSEDVGTGRDPSTAAADE